jgi:hypothetical protein
MQLTPVQSSNLDAVGYDNLQHILFVRFKGKATVYAYQGVPPETHALMMSADSVGSFYARHIKKQFNSEQVGGQEDEVL